MNVYSFSNPLLYFFFFAFLIAVFVSWYFPGALIVRRFHMRLGLHILLSFIVGIALWGVQAYILGYLNLRFVTFAYLSGALILFLRYRHTEVDRIKESWVWLKNHIFLDLMVVMGIIVQLIPVIGSGVRFSDGVRFFGVNAYDGVMHLAFVESIVRHFPPVEPGAHGNLLTNYHYWSDMILADLIRIWHIPVTHVFFQYFPILIAILTALAGYQLIKQLGFSHIAGVWAIFFLFFGADAAYSMMFVVHKTLSFSSPAIDNGATQFLNIPNALARPVFLTSIIALISWLKERKVSLGFITVLLFSVLVGIKIYYGMYVIFGFTLVVGYRVIRDFYHVQQNTLRRRLVLAFHHQKQWIGMGVLLALFSSAIYFPPNQASGGLQWYPLEWVKIFLGPTALNWGDWWLRRQVYQEAQNLRNLLIYDGIGILITLISIHGTRLLGLIPTRSVYKKLGWELSLFFIPGIILFHILGLYTLQESGGFNVFNFFVVSTVVLGLFSAMVLSRIEHFGLLPRIIITVLVVIVTIPRIIVETNDYMSKLLNPKQNSVLVSNNELDAFTFIRRQTAPSDVIQSHPLDNYDSDTPYVSFFADRLTYLTGVRLQETHNQPVKERKELLTDLFNATDSPAFFGKAKSLGINYLYLKNNTEQKLKFSPDDNLLKMVYKNREVTVYHITNN